MARPKKNPQPVISNVDDEPDTDKEAASIELAVNTLTGDMRDFVLQRLRYEQDKRPWNERSEADQRMTVLAVEQAMRDMVKQAVELIAGAGRRSIKATLDSITIKDGIKAVLTMRQGDEQRHTFFDAQGSRVLVIVADPDEFTGEREPAAIKPDEPGLPLDSGVVHSTPDGATEPPFH